MKSNKLEASWGNEHRLFLDYQNWTAEWEQLFLDTAPYDTRTETKPLQLVLPVPERNETLVILDDQEYYHSNYQTLTTLLREDEVVQFYEYLITCRTLSSFHAFQKRLHPIINATYVLFPLDAPQHSAWINPMAIENLWEEPERTFIKMATGPGLMTTTKKDTILGYAANALLSLACTSRDFPIHQGKTGNRPLDFLHFPNTLFAKRIQKHPALQTFPIRLGAFRQRYYLQGAILHYVEEAQSKGIQPRDFPPLSDDH